VLCEHKTKTEKDHYDLVILDECHRVTEANYEFFTKNKVDKILALTATPPKDDIKRDILHNLLKLKISFNYPLDQGVKDGVVAPFKIKIVEVNLSDKKDLVVKTKAKTYTTSEKARYDALTRVINQMMFSGKDVPVYMYLNRMRFLYDLPSKTKLAQKIIKDKFRDDERFLIFSGSIAQAETLCKHSHHSKKKNNDDLIALKAGRINRMSCVKSLNEGENIPNMDSALIVQVTSKDLDLIQRVGRVVRVREGHEAVIWILSVVNTKDADWVAKAIEDLILT
jgi:superfamily II DNA or RNA helicase